MDRKSYPLTIPTEALATRIAADVTGHRPTGLRRFPTGTRHYVFEVLFAAREPVVVRMGDSTARAELAGAARLSGVLRPRGVPLPAILAVGLGSELPWLVLERLAGTDLGAVIGSLPHERLKCIARQVAQAQAATGQTATCGRYGYAAHPEQAPYDSWSQVLHASLDRSRRRMASAGLFEPALVDPVQAAVAARSGDLGLIAPTPFLHDTTTKNVIVTDDGHFSGIVDVDDLCFGDPRYPAALTLAALLAYGGPVEYVFAWLRHAGEPDDRTFRLYVSLFLLDLMAEHGQTFNGNEHPSAPETRAVLCKALDHSLQYLDM